MKTNHTLEDDLKALKEKSQTTTSITVEDILSSTLEKSRLLLIILLCLPFCQPIQIPGFSTPFGIVIAFVSLRVAFGKHIWLPQVLLKKAIPTEIIIKIVDKSSVVLQKMRKFIRPRLQML